MLLQSDIQISEKLNSKTFKPSESHVPANKESNSKRLQVFLRITISVLFVIIVNKSITGKDLGFLFNHISATHAGVALLLSIVGLFLQVARWKMVLGRMNFEIKMKDALKTMLWGNLLAFITPGRIGELFKAVNIDNERKIDTVVAVIVERGYAILTTFLFGILFLIFSLATKTALPLRYTVPMLVLSLILFFIVVFRNKCVFFLSKLKQVRFFRKIPECKLHRELFSWKMFLISILAHLSVLTQAAVLLSMFGIKNPWINFSISGQAFAFMIFLPFFIANIGIREYSFGMFLSLNLAGTDGISTSGVALGISYLVLFFNIILPAIAGLIWYLIDNNKKNESQHC